MKRARAFPSCGAVDASRRNATAASQDAPDYDIDDMEPANFDLDSEDTLRSLRQEFTTKTFNIGIPFHCYGVHLGNGTLRC